MTRVGQNSGQGIHKLQNQVVTTGPKVEEKAQAKAEKAALKEVGTQGIDADKARDFAAGQTGPRTGANVLSVQLAALKNPTLDDMIETIPSSAIYVAKDTMSEFDVTAFLKGEMSPADFKAFLEQANTPTSRDGLQALFGDFHVVVGSMTAEQKTRLDAGELSPIDFAAIRDGEFERLAATEDLPQRPAALDEAPRLYKSSDIQTRVKSGKGANVMFAGQLMDRAVLAGMLEAMAGQGDGRVSRADVEKLLPKILDGNKITTPEESAMLFGMKYLRLTAAADRALAKGIGDAYPDSALARSPASSLICCSRLVDEGGAALLSVVHDNTIAGGERVAEVVTSPFGVADPERVRALIEALAAVPGIAVPPRGALHVHVDASAMQDVEIVVRLVHIYLRLEPWLRRALRTPEGLRSAQPLPRGLLPELQRSVGQPWAQARPALARHVVDRATGLNLYNLLHAVLDKHTVELKLAAASLDASWVLAVRELFVRLTSLASATACDLPPDPPGLFAALDPGGTLRRALDQASGAA